MKINLEKYLKEKRPQLDVEQPDETSVWEGIKAGMAEERKLLPEWFWKVAAIFLLGVLTTYVVVTETGTGKTNALPLSGISDELGSRENELQLIANKKWDEVKPLISKDNSRYEFLIQQLNELESIREVYEEDLKENGPNEYIIRALLDYHEKKIRILDRILLETQKQQNHEKQITL